MIKVQEWVNKDDFQESKGIYSMKDLLSFEIDTKHFIAKQFFNPNNKDLLLRIWTAPFDDMSQLYVSLYFTRVRIPSTFEVSFLHRGSYTVEDILGLIQNRISEEQLRMYFAQIEGALNESTESKS